MFCAPLQGFGYAGGDLELLVGLAPEKGPSCWQSWVACSAASISTKSKSGCWRFLFLWSTCIETSTAHGCVCRACFVSSLIKLPVMIGLKERISVFINKAVTRSWAECQVETVFVWRSRGLLRWPPAAHQPSPVFCSRPWHAVDAFSKTLESRGRVLLYYLKISCIHGYLRNR